MTNISMTVVNLRIPTEHVRLMHERATEEDLTATQLYRRLVRKYIDEHYEPPEKSGVHTFPVRRKT